MGDTGLAKLFMNGRSQAVRLPREFRMAGKQVRVSRTDTGVLLEPILATEAWFEAMDALGDREFDLARSQPEAQDRQPL
ncbi:MAG: AbrB/MazE/SpoVT family DNA-binding domain-containing protein [Candidatus Dormibacteraeota bacterium]|nr:AbrB/MazE/SpoVT family DNA-binding domain-containing protein [Candidatus Dormibacteraeota bacterium]